MLDLKQTDRMLRKLERFVDIIEPMIFEKVGEPGPVSAFATLERFHCIPEDSLFDPIEKGYKWGEEFGYCWFKTDFVVPDGLGGKDIFIRPHISGYEGTLWVDGVPYGNFSTKIVFTGHGNHYCDLLKKDAKAGEKIAIDLEYYAGHSYKGCHPTENNPLLTYDFSYEGIDICVKNYAVQEFYFDLRTLVQLVKNLPESSFRRASVINELEKVFKEIYQSPDDVDRDEFMAALERAKPILKKHSPSKTATMHRRLRSSDIRIWTPRGSGMSARQSRSARAPMQTSSRSWTSIRNINLSRAPRATATSCAANIPTSSRAFSRRSKRADTSPTAACGSSATAT